MATKPTDTPFGLEPNVAAGLAYLLGLIGGIIMFVGGGTNRFVKWSAAQSITLWATVFVTFVVLGFLGFFLSVIPHLGLLSIIILPLYLILYLLMFVAWVWSFITGFQGKTIELPVVAGLTKSIFKVSP
jgi:uncharacterized membrane protein